MCELLQSAHAAFPSLESHNLSNMDLKVESVLLRIVRICGTSESAMISNRHGLFAYASSFGG